jgi:hypothetical protein
MAPKKASDAESGGETRKARRSWQKKSPQEVFFGQQEKLRLEIERDEAALSAKKAQLAKFEEARKIFER